MSLTTAHSRCCRCKEPLLEACNIRNLNRQQTDRTQSQMIATQLSAMTDLEKEVEAVKLVISSQCACTSSMFHLVLPAAFPVCADPHLA